MILDNDLINKLNNASQDGPKIGMQSASNSCGTYDGIIQSQQMSQMGCSSQNDRCHSFGLKGVMEGTEEDNYLQHSSDGKETLNE